MKRFNRSLLVMVLVAGVLFATSISLYRHLTPYRHPIKSPIENYYVLDNFLTTGSEQIFYNRLADYAKGNNAPTQDYLISGPISSDGTTYSFTLTHPGINNLPIRLDLTSDGETIHHSIWINNELMLDPAAIGQAVGSTITSTDPVTGVSITGTAQDTLISGNCTVPSQTVVGFNSISQYGASEDQIQVLENAITQYAPFNKLGTHIVLTSFDISKMTQQTLLNTDWYVLPGTITVDGASGDKVNLRWSFDQENAALQVLDKTGNVLYDSFPISANSESD